MLRNIKRLFSSTPYSNNNWRRFKTFNFFGQVIDLTKKNKNLQELSMYDLTRICQFAFGIQPKYLIKKNGVILVMQKKQLLMFIITAARVNASKAKLQKALESLGYNWVIESNSELKKRLASTFCLFDLSMPGFMFRLDNASTSSLFKKKKLGGVEVCKSSPLCISMRELFKVFFFRGQVLNLMKPGQFVDWKVTKLLALSQQAFGFQPKAAIVNQDGKYIKTMRKRAIIKFINNTARNNGVALPKFGGYLF